MPLRGLHLQRPPAAEAKLEYDAPEHATGVRWSDRAFGIRWPLSAPAMSLRDRSYPTRERRPWRPERLIPHDVAAVVVHALTLPLLTVEMTDVTVRLLQRPA